MKSIYIIVSDSGSFPAKAIKFFTKQKYAHVSISLTKDLKNTYSFGRKYTYMPLPGGLAKEYSKRRLNYFKNADSIVYELKINDYKYHKLKKDLENNYIKKQNEYKYNILGLLYIKRNKVLHRKNHFACSQFIGKLLMDNEIIDFNKDYSIIKPEDFLKIDYDNKVFEGKIIEYYYNINKDIA